MGAATCVQASAGRRLERRVGRQCSFDGPRLSGRAADDDGADGVDAQEPQIPLVRIYGKSVKQEDMARVETGQPYVTVRAAYHTWSAKIRIRFDADQFQLEDVTNLLMRVGSQVGLCEGRPDSPNSCGMGWGLFDVAETKKGSVAA